MPSSRSIIMTIDYTRRFIRMFDKLNVSERNRFIERLELWTIDSRHPMLNDHSLKGRLSGARSFNVGGDLRAVYRLLNDGKLAVFDLIGTHSQLYG